MSRPPARLLLLAALLGGCGTEPGDGAAPGGDALVPDAVLAAAPPEVAAALREPVARARARPDDFAARFELALRLDAHGLALAAAAEYEAAAALHPDARALYHLGVCAGLAGQPERALQAWQRAAAAQPDYAPAQARLGQALLEAGRLDEAQAAFTRAREADPEHPGGVEGLARVALARGEAGQAVALLEPWLAGHPGRGHSRHLLGTALRELGRLDEARPHLEAGARAAPEWSDPWRAEVAALATGDLATLERAVALGRAGAAGQALDALRALHAKDPQDVVALEKLVAALLQEQRLDEARELLARATAGGGHPRAWFLAARVHEQAGDLPRALEAIRRTLRDQPDWGPAHETLARLAWKSGDLAGAATALEEALRLGGEDPVVLVKLSGARRLLGQWEAAEAAARRATAADPRSVPAWVALAEAAAGRGARPTARAAVDEALRLAPGDASLLRLAAALDAGP